MGVSSCIVGRAEPTFADDEMKTLLAKWGLDENYMPLVFVCLGYIDGEYPQIKPRNDGRLMLVKNGDQQAANGL